MRVAVILLWVGLLSPGAVLAQPVDPIAKGGALFSGNCVTCHTGAGMDLKAFPATDKARFVETVTKGKDYMPAWGDKLKPDEVEALWAYVRSIGPK